MALRYNYSFTPSLRFRILILPVVFLAIFASVVNDYFLTGRKMGSTLFSRKNGTVSIFQTFFSQGKIETVPFLSPVAPIFLLAPGSWLRLEQELGREVIGLLRSIFPDKYLPLREIKKMPLYKYRRNPERLKVYLRDLDRLRKFKARIGEEAFLQLCERASQERDGLVYLSCLKDVREDVTIKFENRDEITLPFIAALANMQGIKEMKQTFRLILIRDMATEGKKVFIPEVDEIERYNLEALTLLSRMANQDGINREELEVLLITVGNMLEAYIRGFKLSSEEARLQRAEFERIKAQVQQEAEGDSSQVLRRIERHIAPLKKSVPTSEYSMLDGFVNFIHNETLRRLFFTFAGGKKEKKDAIYKMVKMDLVGEVLHWQENPKFIIAGWQDIAKMNNSTNPARLVFDNILEPISSSLTYLRVSGGHIEAMLDYGGTPKDWDDILTVHRAGLYMKLPTINEAGYLRFVWEEPRLKNDLRQDNLRLMLMKRLFKELGLYTRHPEKGLLQADLKWGKGEPIENFIDIVEILMQVTSAQEGADRSLGEIHWEKAWAEGWEKADSWFEDLFGKYLYLFMQFRMNDIAKAREIAEGKRTYPPLFRDETRRELNRILLSLGLKRLPLGEVGPFKAYRHFVKEFRKGIRQGHLRFGAEGEVETILEKGKEYYFGLSSGQALGSGL